MKFERQQKIVFTLELSGREAELLAGLVQNPLCDPSEEPEEVADLRHDIFNAITAEIDGGKRKR